MKVFVLSGFPGMPDSQNCSDLADLMTGFWDVSQKAIMRRLAVSRSSDVDSQITGPISPQETWLQALLVSLLSVRFKCGGIFL